MEITLGAHFANRNVRAKNRWAFDSKNRAKLKNREGTIVGVNGIYGLSGSGLDIESMVKVGMMSKQNQYDKMYKAEVKANWQKEAYTNVYNEMNSFNMTKLYDYKLSSTTNAMGATSSNTSAVTATAS